MTSRVLNLTEQEINQMILRAKRWNMRNFERRISDEDIRRLEYIKFDFGPGVRTLQEKKQAFTRWVRDNPVYQYPTPSEAINALTGEK